MAEVTPLEQERQGAEVPGRFIGRLRELEIAAGALDAAAGGEGSVLVIAGEAGIGKTRFAQETAALARARGIEVVWAAGWAGGGAPAYWPWPEVLATIDPSAAATLDPASPCADAERFDRFRSIAAAMQRRVAERPLVVVLDDGHSVDADGLLLARFVARGVVGRRLLLVVAHRTTPDVPAFAASLLDEIGRGGVVVRLHGLEPEEVGGFLAANGENAEPELVERVQELADGNPFLLQQVLDAGLHRHDRAVPGGARHLLDAQIDALDSEAQAVLESAAVLGSAATLSELATVAATDRVALERTRDAAAAAGLVRPDRGAPFTFSHDLARETVLSRLTEERRADLHRRCLTMLDDDGRSTERALRRARHALALAGCSGTDSVHAAEIARSSARVLLRHGAPEAAVELLRDALDAHDGAGPGATAPLVTELGFALLATGRLADARLHFGRAVDGTQDTDAITYARAAIGLGGVWVQEHRSAEARRRYDDIVERALRGIGDDPSPLARRDAASLRLRRAAERAAAGTGTVEHVRTALETMRAHGDPHDVAAGLSLLHHVMLGPECAGERVAVATELLDTARSCGDELQILMGLLWRAVDMLLLGQDAGRALSELRERADALGMRAILFVADSIDVMRLMRDGDLGAAEAASAECLQRGLEVGDADASTYHGAHVLGLRWYAGTAAELLDVAEQLAASTAMPPENPIFTAVVAALAAEAGDKDRVERALDALGRGRLRELLPSSSWLLTMFALVEAAVFLDDGELAAELYGLLAPYASLPIMASIGVCCFGSTERALGLAARVAGRLDDASDHLERAVVENQRLGNRPLTAIARGDLAETLAARSGPGDRARAAALFDDAIDAAQRMGLDARRRRWIDRRDHLGASSPSSPTARCIRHAEQWELIADGEHARVPHTVGMSYLAALLAAPRKGISAGELAGLDLVSPPQDVLDATALRTLRQRMTELTRAIEDARREDRPDDAAALQREFDELATHARAATGLRGRSRRFDDPAERARTSVQKAILRAVRNVGRDAPRLAEALRASLHTGYHCRYEPAHGAPERWNVRAH